MFKKLAGITIALALFLQGGTALAAIQGTSITTVVTYRSDPYPTGIRMGAWTDSSSGKLGSFVYPVFRQEWDGPGALSSTSLCNDLSFASSATWSAYNAAAASLTGWTATSNDFPRSVIIVTSFTSEAAGSEVLHTSFTITGTDFYDQTITNTIDGYATTATQSTMRHESTKAFKTVTGLSWTGVSVGTAYSTSSIYLDIGRGEYLGLEWRMLENTVLCELADADGTGGATPQTAGTFLLGSNSVSATTNDWRGSWKPNDVPDGTTDYVLYYIPTDLCERYDGDVISTEYGR